MNGVTETVTAAYGDTVAAPADPTLEGSDFTGLFKGLVFNGEEVDPSYYTVEKGSVKLTIKSGLFEEMPAGTYDLTVQFVDGAVTTRVTVEQKSVAPPTGEPVQLTVCIALAAASIVAFAVIAIKARRKSADY